MSGHTPGPWTVVRPPMDQNAYDVYGDGAQITRGYWAHNAGADAYLIAAAPRMFAKIEALAADGDSEAIAIVEAVNGRS